MKIGFFLLCFLLPWSTSQAYELPLPNKPHLVIEGYATVSQIPDIIKLTVEASATEANLPLAKSAVDKVVGKAINAVKKLKVTEDKINASKIQAHPQYDWSDSRRVYKGETVNRQIEVTLTKPESYNAVVDALLKSGISTIQNVNMDFSNRQTLENKAMTLALKNAEQQAKNISKTLNNDLGNIYQIAPIGQPVIMNNLAMMAKSTSNQESGLKLGKQKIEQRVRVVYLLK